MHYSTIFFISFAKGQIAIAPQRRLSTHAYRDGYIQLAIRSVELLRSPPQTTAELSIWNRLGKQADHLFTFLLYESVPATNNAAERSRRPAVVHRK